MAKNRKEQDFCFKTNEEIKTNGNVRIVGDDIESVVIPISKARKMANELSMDMVLIRDGETPIVRLCNYEKFIYKLKKEQKELNQKNKPKPLKEIQLTANISQHDLETKANNARRFLADGSKVKVVLTRKGREMNFEGSKKSILTFIVMLEDCSVCETELKENGNKTIVILKQKKQ